MKPSCAFCGRADGAHDIAYPHPREPQQAQGEQWLEDLIAQHTANYGESGFPQAFVIHPDRLREAFAGKRLIPSDHLVDANKMIPADQSGSAEAGGVGG